jgi:hypothetical protein
MKARPLPASYGRFVQLPCFRRAQQRALRLWTLFRSRVRASTCCALLSLACAACLVHGDRCGENQVPSPGPESTCICRPGTVPAPSRVGCVPCGTYEEPVAQACQCSAGFVRPGDDMPCELASPGTPGAGCSDTQPCTFDEGVCAEFDEGGFCGIGNCLSEPCAPDDCPLGARFCPAGFTCCDLGEFEAPVCIPMVFGNIDMCPNLETPVAENPVVP